VLLPCQRLTLDWGCITRSTPMPKSASTQIAVIGIDIGKNSFHVVGHDKRGSIVLRQKWSRGQIEARLANLPPCLIDGCRSEVVRYVEVMDGKFGRKKGDILSCMFPVVETDEMTWSRCHACACAPSRGATHPQ
jgi:hypothetical protein